MKFKHKCEFFGCGKEANCRLRNGHWVCHDHRKRLRRASRDLGHNVFFKEVRVGSLGRGMDICIDVPVKFA